MLVLGDSILDKPYARKMDLVHHLWSGTRTPVFAVRGNHDGTDPLGFFRRFHDLTGGLREVAPGLLVAGVGFSADRHYDLPGESDLLRVCDSVRWQARRLLDGRSSLILLTHYPPRIPGVTDPAMNRSGWTFDCVRELIGDGCRWPGRRP